MENFPDVSIAKPGHACCANGSYNTLTHKCCDGYVIRTNEVC